METGIDVETNKHRSTSARMMYVWCDFRTILVCVGQTDGRTHEQIHDEQWV